MSSLAGQSPRGVGESGNSPRTRTHTVVIKSVEKQTSYDISGENVNIVTSAGAHDHGSSKVKLKNIVDYKWEIKNYPGHLIAVHLDGKHIAYVINVNNKVSGMEGMVRVVNAQSSLRALIKGMSGEVLDLQFAHIENKRILASIDATSLFVHRIDTLEGCFLCNLIIKVDDPLKKYTPKYDKITWCPYVDVPDEEDEASQLVVWSRGSKFQCFDVNTIVNEHGIGKINVNKITCGYVGFYDKDMSITWVALSPDGSTLGVGNTDGVIRFYQIYMHDPDPRCLHQWKPHDGKPVSSFFFLDNLTKNVSETYWKFAITGAVNNTELKIWDCGTWECLQTITITSSSDVQKPLRFIAEIDRTAAYLVLSSLETRTCYVMQIVNNSQTPPNSIAKGKGADKNAKSKPVVTSSGAKMDVFIKSIVEFPLNSGILSFSIVNACIRRYKNSTDNYVCEELDEFEEDSNSLCWVVLRLFIVQGKSMQECRIHYQPTVIEPLEPIRPSSSEKIAPIEEVAVAVADGKAIGDSTAVSTAAAVEHSEKLDDQPADDGKSTEEELKSTTQPSALEALLGMASAGGNSDGQITLQTTMTTTSSAVVTVTAGADNNDSRTASPHSTSSSKGFAQVNLMTPDAFNATNNDKSTPECVSSEVLNTILMLANATAPTAKPENVNLLNLMNNKMIEDQEHQKMQMKQSLEAQKKFIAIDNNPDRNATDNLASGGSSPSREVQEIMSLHDYDKSPYSGDELLEEPAPKSATDLKAIDDCLETSVNELESAGTCNTQPSTTNWPKVPDVGKVTTKHSAELQNAANLISQAVNVASAGSHNSSHMAPPALGNHSSAADTTSTASGTGTDSAEIHKKLNQLIGLVKVQSMQINSLQNEIAEIKNESLLSSDKALTDLSFKLEIQLSKLMEQYLKRYESEHKKKLNAFVATRDAQNRELRDSVMQIINHYTLARFGDLVLKIFSIEIKREMTPLLTAKLDALKDQLQMDITQKFTAFHMILKDDIAQVCKNKNIIDAFGKSVLEGVQGSFQSAFVESMSGTLIPAYEKSSQNMFKQLHDAFSVGIKEFMEQFDNYLRHLQPMHETTEDIVNKLGGFRQHLDTMLTTHCNNINEFMSETRKEVKSLEGALGRQIQESVRSEVRRCLENQVVALRSQTTTPAPIYGMKESIKELIQQGFINKAFHQALLGNDLQLVEYTLKCADHNAVFNPHCCLEQKVLLSLIQQISADMSNHNELKQNYLAEALLAINPNNPITHEHAPKVLQELYRNCQAFLLNYPKSAQCSNVRMLMKAVQGYKDQF